MKALESSWYKSCSTPSRLAAPRQALRLVAQVSHHLHDVQIPKRQRPLLLKNLRGSQVVHQPQQTVIALIQNGGPLIQLRVLVPLGGRGQLKRRQMQIAQRRPHLDGNAGQQRLRGLCRLLYLLGLLILRLMGLFRFHRGPSYPRRRAACSMYREPPAKPWKSLPALPVFLSIAKLCGKDKNFVEKYRRRERLCNLTSKF